MKMNSILKNKSMQKLQKMCSSKNMIVFLKYTLIIIFVLVSLNYIMNYLSAEPDYYQGPGSLIETHRGNKKWQRKSRDAHNKLHKKLTALMRDVNDGKYVTSRELEQEVDDAIAGAKSDGMSEQDVRGIFNEMKGQIKTKPSGPSEEEINRMIQAKINQYAVGVVDAVNELKPPDILMETDDGKNPTREFRNKLHNPALNSLAIASPGHRIVRDSEFNKKMSKSLGGGDASLRQRMRNDRFSFLNPSSSGYENTLSRFWSAMLPVSNLDSTNPAKNDEKRRGPLAGIQGALGLQPSSYLGGNPNAPSTHSEKKRRVEMAKRKIEYLKDVLRKHRSSKQGEQWYLSPQRLWDKQNELRMAKEKLGVVEGTSVNLGNESTKRAMNAIKTEKEYLMHLGAMKALQAHEAAHINAKKYNFYPYGPNTLNVYNDEHIQQREQGINQFTGGSQGPGSSEDITQRSRNIIQLYEPSEDITQRSKRIMQA
jgi:hypothetical protein